MIVRGWLGLVVVAFSSAACGLMGPGPSRTPVEPVAAAEVQPRYSAAAQPDGMPGGALVERLKADIASALVARGEHATADGALGGTASWGLNEVRQGRSVDLASAEATSRRFGFGGVVMLFVAFDLRNQALWREQLDLLPTNMPITRYSVRASANGDSAAVVFGSSELEYQPIARTYQPGQSVKLNGTVAARFVRCHVYMTKPDGTVAEQHLPDRSFDASFALDAAGTYRLEVLGDGPTGPVVLANLPLFVGVPEPTSSVVSSGVSEPAQAEARLLELLNKARQSAGLQALQPDAELRVLALDHSTDMLEHGFFGHVSPTTGSPAERVEHSGARVLLSGENVASSATAEAAHESLMSSPGHRANMLRPEFTHVGIGARKKPGGIIVTMVFGQRP